MTSEAIRLLDLVWFAAPGPSPCGLAWDGELLWHSDQDSESIYGIDPARGNVLSTIRCPEARTGLAFDGRYLWQVVGSPKRLRCLDRRSGAIIREVPIVPATDRACGLDVRDAWFWIGIEGVDARLERHRLSDGEVEETRAAEPRISGVTLAGNELWYAEYAQQLLIRTTSDETRHTHYGVTGHPTGLTWDGRRFWYADHTNRRICAVNPAQ